MRILTLIIIALATVLVSAQTLYRYKDADGNWQFTDRPPAEETEVQSERLVTRNYTPQVEIVIENTENGGALVATNEWHSPVQVIVEFTEVVNLDELAVRPLDIVLPPDSTTRIIELGPYNPDQSFSFQFRYSYVNGDNTKPVDSNYLYALPFARGTEYKVTQAFPTKITHSSDSSRHAIDFAMPEGTPIYAARDGVVFATSYENFEGGTDRERDLPKANVVRIAHSDGTMAVYAHLSWNAIRVKPGQRVRRGQYIADSGNTGYSSGPHLHFALHANTGMKIKSIPVVFSGPGNNPVRPMTGEMLFNIE